MSRASALTGNAEADFSVAGVARLRGVLRRHFAAQKKEALRPELSNVSVWAWRTYSFIPFGFRAFSDFPWIFLTDRW